MSDATQNIAHLREHGPTTYEKLPISSLSISDRQHGVRRVHITKAATGGAKRGKQSALAYLDAHDLTTVVRRYLEANPHLLEHVSNGGISAMFADHSSALQDAWREVREEYDTRPTGKASPAEHQAGGEATRGGTCPLCGAGYDSYLRHHFPCDDEAEP